MPVRQALIHSLKKTKNYSIQVPIAFGKMTNIFFTNQIALYVIIIIGTQIFALALW